MKKQIILVFLTVAILIFAQEKSIKQIKQEFDTKKLDMTKVYDTAIELRKCQIKSLEDLKDVAQISESIVDYFENNKSVFKSDRDYFFDYNKIMNDCYSSFIKIQDKDKYLEPTLLELMKEGEDETRIYAIKALGTIKSKKAAPEFRKKVKGFSRTKYKALGFVSEISAYKYILEASEAAEALGSVAEEKDFQLLIDRFYDLEGDTGKGLLKIGKKGFDALLDMARKEQAVEDKKELARGALGDATTIEFIDEWIKILNNKNEYDRIRYSAFYNIVELRDKSSIASNFIENLKLEYNDLDNMTKSRMVILLQKEKDVSFLLSVLSKEKDNDIIGYCLENLSFIGPNLDEPSAVIAAIEKIIYNHGNRKVQSRASSALIKIGEKESLLRLESYIMNNIGRVNKNKDDDEIDLREIRTKLNETQGDK